ncbi:reverse transcriptase domain-containing protein [Tanacetum coccineum]
MQKIGIVVSKIYRAIQFHTPRGIDTVFSTYEPNKVEEGLKKVKETAPKITKNALSCANAEEKITINDKYPEQKVAIRKQLITSFKRNLQELLRSNANIFALAYANMTGSRESLRATYQRLVDKVFEDQIGQNLEANVDDMVIKRHIEEWTIVFDIQETFDSSDYQYETNPRSVLSGVKEEEKETESNEFEAAIEEPKTEDMWKLYTDGASSSNGSGVDLMLVSPEGKEYTYALRFDFETTNNEADCEALLAGLRIAAVLKIKDLSIFVDSQLVANQVKGLFEAC